jgi:hypothetical protein
MIYEDGAFKFKFKYSKIGVCDDEEGGICYQPINGFFCWFLEFKSEDDGEYIFYVACTNNRFNVPPLSDWITEICGDEPAPKVSVSVKYTNQLLVESIDNSDNE